MKPRQWAGSIGLRLVAVLCMAALAASLWAADITVAPVPWWDKIREEAPPSLEEAEKWAAERRLETFAAPGQIEPLSFIIVPGAGEALQDVRVAASDLVGPAGTIPSGALDLFVVKCWYPLQKKGRAAPAETIPELLLHNDKLIKADRDRKKNILNFTGVPTDAAPLAPFDVPKDMLKQVWVNVHVPDAAKPGVYAGQLDVSHAGQSTRLPIRVEALDMRLLESAKENILYPPGEAVDDHAFMLMMKDMKAHGITSAMSYRGVDQRTLELLREAGLLDRLLLFVAEGLTFPPADLQAAAERAKLTAEFLRAYAPGLEFYVMTRDEPSLESYRKEEPAYRVYRKNGLRTAVAGPPPYLLGGDATDLAIRITGTWWTFKVWKHYALAADIAESHALGRRIMNYGHGPGVREPKFWRYRVGFWMFGSRFDGNCHWTYMVAPPDAGAWNPEQDWGEAHFAYPAADRMIPTTQWEAYRAGAYDGRYMTTLAAQILTAERLALSSAEITEGEMLLDASAEIVNPDELNKLGWNPAAAIDGAKVQAFRRKVADRILAIQKTFPQLSSHRLAKDVSLPEQARKWRIGKEPNLRGEPPFAAGEFFVKFEDRRAAMDRGDTKAAAELGSSLQTYIGDLLKQGALNDAEYGYLAKLAENPQQNRGGDKNTWMIPSCLTVFFFRDCPKLLFPSRAGESLSAELTFVCANQRADRKVSGKIGLSSGYGKPVPDTVPVALDPAGSTEQKIAIPFSDSPNIAITAQWTPDLSAPGAQAEPIVPITVLRQSILVAYPCGPMKRAVKVDGKLDEWKELPAITLGKTEQMLFNGPWRAPSDGAGKVWVAWDTDNFYVAAHVKKSWKVMNDETEAKLRDGDCLELFLEPRYSENGEKTSYNANTTHVLIAPINGDLMPALYSASRLFSAPCQVESQVEENEYTMEAAIPWSNFSWQPLAGEALGFDLQLDIGDKKAGRFAALGWCHQGQADKDRTAWGRLRLTE